MDFRHQVISLDTLAGIAADALLVVIHGEAPDLSSDSSPDSSPDRSSDSSSDSSFHPALDPVIAALADDAIAQGDFKFKSGRTLYLHRPAGVKARRLVVTVAKDGEPKAFKAALANGLGALKSLGAKHVAIALAGGVVTDAHAEAFVNAACDAAYVYRETKPSAPPAPVFSRFTLVCAKADVRGVTQGLTRGQAIADGVLLARECANLPSNMATPTYLAEQAQKLGKTHGLKVEVFDRKGIEKIGMGSFLAVTQGSVEPPRFIVVRYDGAPKGRAPVVLVGKGITFDTGGISIKPAAGMDEMKYDMGGAASVLGTLSAIATLKPKLNLVCLIPTCENMPSGTAIKPGDVVTSLSGQTIEILNTDAEGRLILCDALTYAERFKPAVVVDIATLTGACVVALGHHYSGLFTEDDTLAEELGACSRAAQDPCWRMPVDDAYDEGLKSNFADMANVGPREGGAITAAMFLRRYTGKYRWAHLDVAGTAWKGGTAKGSTGRPVPLLTHFVLSQAG